MRRTRKWTFVAQEAQRLATLGLSSREIAKRLEVSKATVNRWMAAGKLPRQAAQTPESSQVVAMTGQTPQEWAKAVRDAYALDVTDDQMVRLAEEALTVSLDRKVGPAVRMTAAGRFQALVRQLALVARNAPVEQPAQPPEERKVMAPGRVLRRRRGGDPRTLLMAVK